MTKRCRVMIPSYSMVIERGSTVLIMSHIALRQAHGAVQEIMRGEKLKFYSCVRLISSRYRVERIWNVLAHEQKQSKNTKKCKKFWIEKFDSKLQFARETIFCEGPKPDTLSQTQITLKDKMTHPTTRERFIRKS